MKAHLHILVQSLPRPVVKSIILPRTTRTARTKRGRLHFYSRLILVSFSHFHTLASSLSRIYYHREHRGHREIEDVMISLYPDILVLGCYKVLFRPLAPSPRRSVNYFTTNHANCTNEKEDYILFQVYFCLIFSSSHFLIFTPSLPRFLASSLSRIYCQGLHFV